MPSDSNSSGQPSDLPVEEQQHDQRDAGGDQPELAAFGMDRGPVPFGLAAAPVVAQFSGHPPHLGKRPTRDKENTGRIGAVGRALTILPYRRLQRGGGGACRRTAKPATTWQRVRGLIAGRRPDLPHSHRVAGILLRPVSRLRHRFRRERNLTQAFASTSFPRGAMFIVDLLWLLVRHRPAARRPSSSRPTGRRARDPRFIARLPLLAIAIVFMPFFSQLKSMIPLFNAFRLGPGLSSPGTARCSSVSMPGRSLQPVFGYPVDHGAARRCSIMRGCC